MSGVRHRTFERGFADTHDVVAGDDFLTAEIRQCQDAAAGSQNSASTIYDRQQAVDADLHRDFESFAAARDGQPLEIINRSVRHRVQHEVDRAEMFLRGGEDSVEVRVILDITRHEEFCSDRLDQLFDAAFHLRHRWVFVGQMSEPHLRPFLMQTLGDRPGDRVIVGNPEDQTFFAAKHAHCE